MNNLIQNNIVKPLDGFDAPIFLIEDNNDFSITEFKMMESLKCLLKCKKTSLDGILQLVYLNDEYVPLKTLYAQLTEDKLTGIIGDICDALSEIRSNGFMHCNNVVFSIEKIYINPLDMFVKLVYLPAVSGEATNDLSIVELNAFFLSLIEGSELTNSQTINAIRFFGVTNPNATLDDVKHFYKDILNGKGKKASLKEEKKQKKVLYLKSNDAGVETVFKVDQPVFTIGKKRSAVDGFLPNNPYLSRVHCEIQREDDCYFISDLGSANGTFVNDMKLKTGDRIELHDKDSIRLSSNILSVEFREK